MKKRIQPNSDLSKDEMLACLQRSGYLLESRVVRFLQSKDLFVEPNQTLLDERTGISREVDIVAEINRFSKDRPKTCVKTTLVMEVVNNLYPVVLLTRRAWTPNSPIDEYLQYKTTPPPAYDEEHPFLWKVNLDDFRSQDGVPLFSQYCAFSEKKSGEFMASHPEDLHASIRKAAEYLCDALDPSSTVQAYKRGVIARFWRLIKVDVFAGCAV
jgi:hypothetical protein